MATICTIPEATAYFLARMPPDTTPDSQSALKDLSLETSRELMEGFKSCPIDRSTKELLIGAVSGLAIGWFGNRVDQTNAWRLGGAEAYIQHAEIIRCYEKDAQGDLDLPSNYFSNLLYFKPSYGVVNFGGGILAFLCGYIAAMIQLHAPPTGTFIVANKALGPDNILKAWDRICRWKAVGWSAGVFVLMLGGWNLVTYLARRDDRLSVRQDC